MTSTFNPLRAMVMTYLQAKVQGQRSVGSENRVETNGRTEGYDCITTLRAILVRSIINNDNVTKYQMIHLRYATSLVTEFLRLPREGRYQSKYAHTVAWVIILFSAAFKPENAAHERLV